jgi:hypothetical protein
VPACRQGQVPPVVLGLTLPPHLLVLADEIIR